MALNGFIPAIWSARLLFNLHKALVFASPGIVNHDYEGEVKVGSSVKINSIGPVAVTDYEKNVDHVGPETLTEAQRTLLIDQQKMFNFQVDKIDQVQQNPKVMDEAMREAAYAIADVQDQFIANAYSDAAPGNAVGSTAAPVAITSANAYAVLLRLKAKLDKANVPKVGRYVVLPTEWIGSLLLDNRFVGYGTEANKDGLTNGRIGRAAGFDIYESNNVAQLTGADAGKFKIVAGSPIAITFASQIAEMESYKPEKRFGDAVKGLFVYGKKVARPAALAVATATFPEE